MEELEKKSLGIKSFLKAVVEKEGKQYDEDKTNLLIESYSNNYDSIVGDIGRKVGIPEDGIQEFKKLAFDKYKIQPISTPEVQQTESDIDYGPFDAKLVNKSPQAKQNFERWQVEQTNKEETPSKSNGLVSTPEQEFKYEQEKPTDEQSFTQPYLSFDKGKHPYDLPTKSLPKSQFDIDYVNTRNDILKGQTQEEQAETISENVPIQTTIEQETWEDAHPRLNKIFSLPGGGIARGAYTGTKAMIGGVGTAIDFMASNIVNNATGGMQIDENGKITAPWEDNYKENKSDFYKSVREYEANVPTAKGGAMEFVGQMIPQTAGLVAVVLTRNPSLSKAYLGQMYASSFGMGIEAYDDYTKETGQKSNETDRYLVGLGYGTAEYIGEKIGLDYFMPKGYGKVVAGALKASPATAQEIGKSVLENYAKVTKQSFPGLLKKIAIGSQVEGAQEDATELMQAAIDKWMIGKDVTGIELRDRLVQSHAGGTLMGASIAPFASISQNSSNTQRRRQQGTVTISIDEKGLPLEIIKTDDKTIGVRPDGEEVSDISKETLDKAITYETPQFEAAITEFNQQGIAKQETQTQTEEDIKLRRQEQIDQKITSVQDNEGNVTTTEIDGQKVYVKNAEDLGKPGATIFVRDEEGNTKPINSKKITTWNKQTPEEVKTDITNEDAFLEAEKLKQQEVTQKAADKGIEVGAEVENEFGTGTVTDISKDGVITAQDEAGQISTSTIDETVPVVEEVDPQIEIDAKKADIEKRRQEELTEYEYDIRVKEDVYEGTDTDGEVRRQTIYTNKDGSRLIYDEIKLEDGTYTRSGRERLNKDNTLSNEEYLNKSYGIINPQNVSTNTDLTQRNNNRLSKINAKYDQELSDLEKQKPVNIDELTSEEAYLELSKTDPKAAKLVLLDDIEEAKNTITELNKLKKGKGREERAKILHDISIVQDEIDYLENKYLKNEESTEQTGKVKQTGGNKTEKGKTNTKETQKQAKGTVLELPNLVNNSKNNPQKSAESVNNLGQEVITPKQLNDKFQAKDELTEEQKVKVINRLLDDAKYYDKLPKNHTKKIAAAGNDLQRLANSIGYSIGKNEKGKTTVFDENKNPIKRKIPVRQSKEDIEAHNALSDYEQEFQDLANWFMEDMNRFNQVKLYNSDSGQLQSVVKNIQAGNKTVAANNLLDDLKQIFDLGEISFTDGFGAPLNEFVAMFIKEEDILWELILNNNISKSELNELFLQYENDNANDQRDVEADGKPSIQQDGQEPVDGNERNEPEVEPEQPKDIQAELKSQLETLQSQFKQAEKAYSSAQSKYQRLNTKLKNSPEFGNKGQAKIGGGVAGADLLNFGEDDLTIARKAVKKAKDEMDNAGAEVQMINKQIQSVKGKIGQQDMFIPESKQNQEAPKPVEDKQYDWDIEFSEGNNKGQRLSELPLESIDMYDDNISSANFENGGIFQGMLVKNLTGALSIAKKPVKIAIILDGKMSDNAGKLARIQRIANNSGTVVVENPSKTRDDRQFPFMFVPKSQAADYTIPEIFKTPIQDRKFYLKQEIAQLLINDGTFEKQIKEGRDVAEVIKHIEDAGLVVPKSISDQFPEAGKKVEAKTILDNKVTGSQFKGETWRYFIDKISEYFLPTFNKPLVLTNTSDVIFDNFVKKYGQEDIEQFIADVKANPKAVISIETSDKGRTFKTVIPEEAADYLLSKVTPTVKESLPVEKPVFKTPLDKKLEEAKEKKDPETTAERISRVSAERTLKEIMENGSKWVADPEAVIKKILKYTGVELVKDEDSGLIKLNPEVTDRTEVQKIKNSINEGESILKSGKKISGDYYSQGELETVYNSVIKSKIKIGDTSNTIPAKTKEKAKPQDQPVTWVPDDISYRLAYDAYSGSSFSPEKRAKSVQEGFVQDMDKIYETLSKIAKSPEQIEVMWDQLARYKDGYIKKYNAYLSAASRTLSSMITGPANFPVRRNEKALQVADKRSNEFTDWVNNAEKSAIKAVKNSATAEQKEDEAWNNIKKEITSKAATIIAIDKGIEKGLSRPLFANSLSGFIRRIFNNGQYEHVLKSLDYIDEINSKYDKPVITSKSKIWEFREQSKEALAKQETEPEVIAENETIYESDGIQIINNKEIERVQIVTPDKPTQAVINQLKSAGWNWSPRNKAWQRKNTPEGIRAAIKFGQEVYPKTDEEGNSVLFRMEDEADPRFQIIGESGAANLDKAEEATTRLDNLGVAREMETGRRGRKVLFVDEHGKNIVYDDGNYRIAVDDVEDGRYITLWHREEVKGKEYWAKRGVLDAWISRFDKFKDRDGKYLSVRSVEIEKAHRNKGLGSKMYQALIDFSSPEVKGLVSYLPNRVNKTQVPSIYKRLNGKIEGDYHFIDLSPKTPQQIKLATGWERGGKDNKWRYEVPDIELKFTFDEAVKNILNETLTLSDVVNDPELFKAYPELKNTKIQFYERKAFGSTGGTANSAENTIGIVLETRERKIPELGGGRRYIAIFPHDGSSLKSVLSHEIQHLIQGLEGFARGGNRETVLDSIIEDRIRQLQEVLGVENLTQEQKEDVEKKVYRQYPERYRAYQQISGEVEARNVQRRIDLTPEQRRESLLSETQDVATKDQIFIYDSLGPSNMTEIWHGSPHKFDKFLTQFMGTGEGAQAYGWGLYFTDKEGIAREYAGKLDNVNIAKQFLTDDEASFRLMQEIITFVPTHAKGEWLIENIESGYYEDFRPSEIEILRKFAEHKIKNNNDLSGGRNLYKVKIHGDKTIEELNFLRWDKPLSKKQKEIIDNVVYKNFGGAKTKEQSDKFREIDKEVSRLSKLSFGTVYNYLSDQVGSQKTISLQLLENGINGIQYPSEYTTKGQHEESFNYVVFDENAIEIEDSISFKVKPDAKLTISDTAQSSIKEKKNTINALNTLVGQFGVPITVIHSSELSEVVGMAAKRKRGTPVAFYHNGTAYIISDKIQSVSDTKQSYLHEAILHKGLDLLFNAGPVTVLGKKYNTKNELLDEVYSRLSPELISEISNKYTGGETSTKKQQREIAEEVLAKLNELEKTPSRLQVFMDSLWKFIKKLVGFSSKQFTMTDLHKMLSDHRNQVKKLARGGISESSDTKLNSAIDFFTRLKDDVIPETIKVNGKERPTRNSNGEFIHPNLGGIKNFWKWFGESKVVDEQGRPKIVYHGGASGTTEFDTNRAGSVNYADWGKGIYFTPAKWMADGYREDSVLNSDKESDRLYEEMVKRAKELGTTPMNVSIDLGFQSPGYNEISKLREKWMKYRDIAKKNGGEVYEVYLKIDNPLIHRYEEMTDPFLAESAKYYGNDGIIVTPMTEYVVFSPTQIKSATGNRGTFDENDPNINFRFRSSNPEVNRVIDEFNARKNETPPTKPKSKGTTKSNEVEKTFLTKRTYHGDFEETLKQKLEAKGLTREVEDQKDAHEVARTVIEMEGLEESVNRVRDGEFFGAVGAAIWYEKLMDIRRQQDEEVNPEKYDRLEQEFADITEEMGTVALNAGRFNSFFGYIYKTSDLGFNAEKLIRDYKKINNGEITTELEEKFKKLAAEYKDTQERLAAEQLRVKELEEQASIDAIKASIERQNKKKAKASDKIRETTDKLIELIDAGKLNRPGIFMAASPASLAWDLAMDTVKTAVKATGRTIEAIAKGFETIKSTDWYKNLDANKKKQAKNAYYDYFTKADDKKDKDEKETPTYTLTKNGLKIPHSVIRDLVEQGIDNIEDLTQAVYDVIVDDLPDITEREVRDAITGYGNIMNQNQEEIEREIRKMKDLGRAISGLEDISEGKRPQKSGLQRDKPDPDQRAIHKQVREAMKLLPVDEERKLNQQKTQLDAAKQRLINHIEDLQREIDKGELTPKNARTMQEDDELIQLRKDRDAKKAEHEALFNDEDFLNKKRVELSKKAVNRRIAELEKRIADGDFAPKERKELIADNELIKLRAEKLRIQEEYDHEKYKAKLRNRTDAQKWKDRAWDGWNLARALNATFDFSFVGVQGLTQTLSHPINAKHALKNSFRFFASQRKTDKWIQEIKSQDWYPLLKESKLSITEPTGEISAREELFYSGWTDWMWNALGKLLGQKPETWIDYSPIRAFERSAVGYLDTLRVLRFLDGMEMLKDKGIAFNKENKDAYKQMADGINTFTGRGSIGSLNAELMSKIFYSPRNWASQFKTATPYAFYHFGKMRAGAEAWKPSVAQKMALADFSKAVGLTTAIVALAAALLNGDDDDDNKVELDARSSNFGKIIINGIPIDPWGGRIQQIVLTARFINGNIKNSYGEIVPIGTPRKSPTYMELLYRAGTNKLAPTPRIAFEHLSTRWNADGEKEDAFGNPYTFYGNVVEKMHPMYANTVYELAKDDVTALDGLMAFWAFWGGGLQTSDMTPEKITDRKLREQTIIKSQFKEDLEAGYELTKEDSIQYDRAKLASSLKNKYRILETRATIREKEGNIKAAESLRKLIEDSKIKMSETDFSYEVMSPEVSRLSKVITPE